MRASFRLSVPNIRQRAQRHTIVILLPAPMEACGGDTPLATLRLNATPIPSKALLHEAHLLALESFTSAKLAWRRFS